MRKLILISAFVLASVSAQAGEIREQILAVNDAPAAAATPAPPAPAPAAPAAASSPPAAAPAAAAEAPAPRQASRVSSKQAYPSQKLLSRREGDEQKACRIAARYGVYW